MAGAVRSELKPGQYVARVCQSKRAKWLGLSVRNSYENSGRGVNQEKGTRKKPRGVSLGAKVASPHAHSTTRTPPCSLPRSPYTPTPPSDGPRCRVGGSYPASQRSAHPDRGSPGWP